MAGRADVARENGKKGGRPKGRKNDTTLEKDAAREVTRQIITASLEPMLQDKSGQMI